MKAYVIRIKDNERSCEAADRCIASAKKVRQDVEIFDAITPKDDPLSLFKKYSLPLKHFEHDAEQWSRYLPVLACFLSHYEIWRVIAAINQETLILEHDAIFENFLPSCLLYDRIITLGKPSYGKFNTPTSLGTQSLMHKPYFGGAHAYVVSPEGANDLLIKASIDASPTDVFLSTRNFPTIQEYYPWPISCQDSFTTVQKQSGCLAKHNYKEDSYDII